MARDSELLFLGKYPSRAMISGGDAAPIPPPDSFRGSLNYGITVFYTGIAAEGASSCALYPANEERKRICYLLV